MEAEASAAVYASNSRAPVLYVLTDLVQGGIVFFFVERSRTLVLEYDVFCSMPDLFKYLNAALGHASLAAAMMKPAASEVRELGSPERVLFRAGRPGALVGSSSSARSDDRTGSGDTGSGGRVLRSGGGSDAGSDRRAPPRGRSGGGSDAGSGASTSKGAGGGVRGSAGGRGEPAASGVAGGAPPSGLTGAALARVAAAASSESSFMFESSSTRTADWVLGPLSDFLVEPQASEAC